MGKITMKTEMELEKITQQFIDRYQPEKIFLFGSQAKSSSGRNSDIDLCVIVEVADKRKLLTDIYLNIVSDLPFDVLLYSPGEWDRCVADRTSFAYQIIKEGVMLHG